MCAQIYLKVKANELAKRFGITISEDLSQMVFEKITYGYMKTETCPVVVFSEDKFQIKEMYFSLCPAWSKEFPCKWSTYNARLERDSTNEKTGKVKREFIFEVATWRDAFSKGRTCLVPISGAIESSYFGSHAGNIVRFSDSKDEVFYALGICSEWVDKKTGEVKETFALLTDDPYEFFFETGHDRSIIVIGEKNFDRWLKDTGMSPQERFEFIRESRVSRKWKVDVERPMKSGWEKRAPSESELKQVAVFK